MSIVAAVEGGGTSFVVAVAEVRKNQPPKILQKAEFDSSHDQPHKTLSECASFLETHKPEQGYASLGLATFGPVGVNASLKTYGSILGTSPKASWRNIDMLTPLKKACQGSQPLQVRVETDVNAPALAEYTKLNDPSISSLAYVTVGTGVGVGLVINGKCVHGRMHPEGGHVAVQPLPSDNFPGYSWGEKSPFKGKQTVEGIASSVALTERYEFMLKSKEKLDRSILSALPDDHELWDHAANALANLCVTLLLTTSIEKVCLGGGVCKRKGLLDKVRKQTVHLLNGYLELPDDMSTLIDAPLYGDEAGLMGAIVLAERAALDTEDDAAGEKAKKEQTYFFYQGVIHGVVLGALAGIVGMALLGRRKS